MKSKSPNTIHRRLLTFLRYGNDVGVLSIDGGPPGDDIFGFAGLAAEGAQEPPFIVSRRTRAVGMLTNIL